MTTIFSPACPAGQEKHGTKGTPEYVPNAGFSFETKTGTFQLSPHSPGYHKALVIPNFCESSNGAAPDMGAHESGTPPMVYGVKAQFIPPKASATSPAGYSVARRRGGDRRGKMDGQTSLDRFPAQSSRNRPLRSRP